MRGEGWSQGPKPDPCDFGRPSYSVVSRIPPNLAKNPFPKSDRLLEQAKQEAQNADAAKADGKIGEDDGFVVLENLPQDGVRGQE